MRTTMTALTVMVAFAASAQAQDNNYDDTQTRGDKPVFSIGAGMIFKPEYSGADSYDSMVLPLITAEKEITPGNTAYFKGLKAGLDHKVDEQLTVGLLGSYRFSRDSSDSSKLTGMNDVDGAFEMGPKVRYQVTPQVGIEGNMLFDVSGAHDGFTARAGADYVQPLSRVTFLTVDGGLNYGSEDFTQAYYGVKSFEARPGRPAYSPEGGFSSVDAGVGLRHMISPRIAITGRVGAEYLLGDAADSPIVEQELQPKAMLGVAYSF